jgi:fucose 4-O-acetylase-like acetyltransferase
MRERDLYIDCLRSVMIALVLLAHTAITYGASGLWFYHELSPFGALSSKILTLFSATNQAYLMGFLFLLAGYFTPGSPERKGYARFLGDRFLRLGLPLLAFGLILGPLTVAMVAAAEDNGFWSTLVQLWNNREFIIGPLWFNQALLIFSLAYCAWRAWFGAPLTCTQREPRPIPSYLLVAPERVWRQRRCARHPADCAYRYQRDWNAAWILRQLHLPLFSGHRRLAL